MFVVEVMFMAINASSSPAFAQANQIRVSLTTSQTPASLPAIPTADIARLMKRECPNVNLTANSGEADYALEAVGGDRTNPHGQRLYKFALFGQDGNVVFTTETRRMGNAIKNVCTFLNKPAG
jgi:hypothetical protein